MIGLRKIIAKAVANGKWIKDRTTNIDVAVPRNARKTVIFRLFVEIIL
tara:strand:- start:2310 stop:2453 length:144 start_codon:yes stop_codon:yes gene_type:complete